VFAENDQGSGEALMTEFETEAKNPFGWLQTFVVSLQIYLVIYLACFFFCLLIV